MITLDQAGAGMRETRVVRLASPLAEFASIHWPTGGATGPTDRPNSEGAQKSTGVEGATNTRSATGSTDAPIPARRWRVVPDAAAHLLVHRHRNGTTLVRLVGPRTRHLDVDQASRLFTVGIRLRAGALPSLTGMSAWELRDRGVRLGDIWGRSGDRLEERLTSAASAEDALSLAVQVLAWARTEEVDWRIRCAMQDARRDREWRVGSGARRMGIGERSLRETFRQELGLRPKEAHRVERLQGALGTLLRGAPAASVAVSVGYADQAHMVREFHALLGESPTAFVRRATRRILQDRPRPGT